MGGEHDYKLATTYPNYVKSYKTSVDKPKGEIIVEDDVWIGYGENIDGIVNTLKLK